MGRGKKKLTKKNVFTIWIFNNRFELKLEINTSTMILRGFGAGMEFGVLEKEMEKNIDFANVEIYGLWLETAHGIIIIKFASVIIISQQQNVVDVSLEANTAQH